MELSKRYSLLSLIFILNYCLSKTSVIRQLTVSKYRDQLLKPCKRYRDYDMITIKQSIPLCTTISYTVSQITVMSWVKSQVRSLSTDPLKIIREPQTLKSYLEHCCSNSWPPLLNEHLVGNFMSHPTLYCRQLYAEFSDS